MVAVALLDERSHQCEPPEMLAKARTILYYYNKALRILTAPNLDRLDLYLAPVLCWILETMINDTAAARMHVDASRRPLQEVHNRRKWN